MNFVAAFFAGAFLCNCIPHLVAGLQGMPFQTPFAKPPGIGESSPLVNFLWGGFNLLVSLALLTWQPVIVGVNAEFIVMTIGALAVGSFSAIHFGKVRQGK